MYIYIYIYIYLYKSAKRFKNVSWLGISSSQLTFIFFRGVAQHEIRNWRLEAQSLHDTYGPPIPSLKG